MSAALLVARLVLAAVFVAAGLAKFADRDGAREAAADFGVPRRLVGAIVVALPVLELATAGLLLPSATAQAGAFLALVLLLAFCAAIANALRQGHAPDCHCFGQLHAQPAGPATLARNGALAAVAVFVIAGGPGPSAVGWPDDLQAGVAVAVIVAAAGLLLAAGSVALSVGLLRRHGAALHRIDRLEAQLEVAGLSAHDEPPAAGLPIGTPAPVQALPGLADRLGRGHDAVVLFTDPQCGPCQELAPDIATWRNAPDQRLGVVTVGPDGDLVDDDRSAATAFEATGTPMAVVIDRRGTIASRVAAGPVAIRALVAQAAAQARRPRVGEPMPSVRLQTVEGAPVDLAEPREHDVVLVLWNPTCGFCSDVRDDVLAAERDGIRLVVVSSGAEQDGTGDPFSSPLVLDPDFAAGDALGATGTPSAVRVDAEGRLASETAVGADEVRHLLGRTPALPVQRYGGR